MIRTIVAFFGPVLLGACASAPVGPSTAISDLAPTGKLRAVINFGNPILARKDEQTGEPKGVSVDLARELAKRLGVDAELVTVISAGDAVEKLASGRVAVGNKSAYDLFLTCELRKAKIERAPTPPVVVDYLLAQRLDVAAGVKRQLEMDAKRIGNLRLLPGRFMVINQAMGMARDKEAGAKYLTSFVEEMKSSGFVADALARHKIDGATVAPPRGQT